MLLYAQSRHEAFGKVLQSFKKPTLGLLDWDAEAEGHVQATCPRTLALMFPVDVCTGHVGWWILGEENGKVMVSHRRMPVSVEMPLQASDDWHMHKNYSTVEACVARWQDSDNMDAEPIEKISIRAHCSRDNKSWLSGISSGSQSLQVGQEFVLQTLGE